jgi:hypothetical protein
MLLLVQTGPKANPKSWKDFSVHTVLYTRKNRGSPLRRTPLSTAAAAAAAGRSASAAAKALSAARALDVAPALVDLSAAKALDDALDDAPASALVVLALAKALHVAPALALVDLSAAATLYDASVSARHWALAQTPELLIGHLVPFARAVATAPKGCPEHLA